MTLTKYYAGAAAAAVIVGLAGIYAATVYLGPSGPEACGGDPVAGADIGGPFTLVSDSGAEVSDTEVIDRPALIYFGYTFCPDVCPFDTVRNADAAALLAEMGYDVRPVMITVDPRRDTVEVMAAYTDNIYEPMMGLTGSPEQIAAAAGAYRVYYSAHDSEDEFYLVDHSTFTYLMLPDTGLAGIFRRETTAKEVAEMAACLIDGA